MAYPLLHGERRMPRPGLAPSLGLQLSMLPLVTGDDPAAHGERGAGQYDGTVAGRAGELLGPGGRGRAPGAAPDAGPAQEVRVAVGDVTETTKMDARLISSLTSPNGIAHANPRPLRAYHQPARQAPELGNLAAFTNEAMPPSMRPESAICAAGYLGIARTP
jgi:hypothetical protein